MTATAAPTTTAVGGWTPSLDPVEFEIVRHRLWAINDEAATTIKLVSGSPVATEAGDMNTALMNAEGEVFVVGAYSLAKATTMTAVTKDVLANYAEAPGIRDGDAFICNDPYVGAQHQNDTALVMPQFLARPRNREICGDLRRAGARRLTVARRGRPFGRKMTDLVIIGVGGHGRVPDDLLPSGYRRNRLRNAAARVAFAYRVIRAKFGDLRWPFALFAPFDRAYG